jgi:hypothetical protein
VAEQDPVTGSMTPAVAAEMPRPTPVTRVTGSLGRRMIVIAALWILVLLAGGGFALDRVLTSAVTRNFDDQLDYVLTCSPPPKSGRTAK